MSGAGAEVEAAGREAMGGKAVTKFVEAAAGRRRTGRR
jgi:hypothetical protein